MTQLVPFLFLAAVLLGVWMLSYVTRPDPVAAPKLMLLAHGGLGILGLGLVVYLVNADRLVLTPNANLALITGGGVAMGGLIAANLHRQPGKASGLVLLLHGLFGAIVATLLSVWALG